MKCEILHELVTGPLSLRDLLANSHEVDVIVSHVHECYAVDILYRSNPCLLGSQHLSPENPRDVFPAQKAHNIEPLHPYKRVSHESYLINYIVSSHISPMPCDGVTPGSGDLGQQDNKHTARREMMLPPC